MTEELQRLKFYGQSLIEGYKEFAHNPAKPEFSIKDAPSQKGKVWIVTGSTSGIGYEVACQLAEMGAHVWLTGRCRSKTKERAAMLRNRLGEGNCKVDYLLFDFTDLRSVKPGVAPFLKSKLPLHGIVHNAGVMLLSSPERTVQCYETQLAVNALGPWLLQKVLDPVLLETSTSSEGRIVWVSSLAHYGAPYDGSIIAKNPQKKGYFPEMYCHSKAIDAMMSIQWSKVHPEANVKSVSVHPGVIDTQLTRDLPELSAFLFSKFAWPVEYGAASELAAALSNVPNNSYIVPFGRIGKMRSDIRAAAEKDLTLANWLDGEVDVYAKTDYPVWHF